MRPTTSSTGEIKSVRAQFELAPSINDLLNALKTQHGTSRNAIIESAILLYASKSQKEPAS